MCGLWPDTKSHSGRDCKKRTGKSARATKTGSNPLDLRTELTARSEKLLWFAKLIRPWR